MAGPDAELDIGLRWIEARQALDVELRFARSDQNIDILGHDDDPIAVDLKQFHDSAYSADEYAQIVTRLIFDHPKVAKFYSDSRKRAPNVPLHLRLRVDGPPSLHTIRWELLQDPDTGHPLTTSADVLFSRYLTDPGYRVVPWRSRQATRALVVIANPRELQEEGLQPRGRKLAPVKVDLEKSIAEAALKGFQTEYLVSGGKATLANVIRRLGEAEQQVDILYLVCHGALLTDVPLLYLEDENGNADAVDGRRLQEVVSALPVRPTLVVLNSCQSGGPGGVLMSTDDGVLAGLGPRLAAAGVATVIAMQGDVTMETARLFSETFFAEMKNDGLIDRSVAAARRRLRENDRDDWWVPVLFSRLRSGRSYFKAEFTGNGELLWSALAASHKTGNLTPVLGPGMSDELLGSRETIAESWTVQWQLPVLTHNREDLAKVAQYLRVQHHSSSAVANQLEVYLQEEIAERIKNAAGDPADPFHGLDPQAKPGESTMKAGLRQLQDDPGNAYRVLATIPAPLFITTNWTGLLEQALKHNGKKPTTMFFPWTDRRRWPVTKLVAEPTKERPLVYHLFGRAEDPLSLVLAEEDYLEWLTAWVAKKGLVPDIVRYSLVDQDLLFLGYHLEDWEFRTVFEGIKSIPSSSNLLAEHIHVGVQVNPGGHDVEPEAAQDYLESYFKSANVGVYWADTRAFLDEYRRRLGIET